MRQNPSRLSNNFQDWEVGPNYEIKKIISHGSFKKAVEALQIPTNKKVIIAKFHGIFDDLHQSIKVLRELILCRKANHPNLLKIIDIIEPTHAKDFNVLYVVFEYMMSDIAKILKSPIHLETVHVQDLLYHTLATLKYLHSSGLVHRDLKPRVVMLNEDCSIKICGFDSVKTVNEIGKELLKVEVPKREIKSGKKLIKKSGGLIRNNRLRREYCGRVTYTSQYRAPDVLLLKKSYTSAIDVWSAGCIFADLLNMMKENAPTFLDRSSMFYGDHNVPLSPSHKKENSPSEYMDYLNTVFSVVGTPKPEGLEFMGSKFEIGEIGKLPFKKGVNFAELFPGSSEEAVDLLKRMLEVNPDKRITIDECFYHPFLKTVSKKEMESSAKSKIALDFEINTDEVIKVEKMRELFLKEIECYKKN